MYVLVKLCRAVHTAYLVIFLITFFVGLATTMCMFLLYQTSYNEVRRSRYHYMHVTALPNIMQ